MSRVPSHVTPLKLSQRVGGEPGGAYPPAALTDPSWMGTPIEPAPDGTRRFLTDLSLPVREHSPVVLFKKAAFVDVGRVKATPEGCEMEIGWQSASLAPLFPVFAGRLRLSGSEITLEGFYAPPGGQIGAALDRAFLNIAARGTARWFLEKVEAALEAEWCGEADPCRPIPARPTRRSLSGPAEAGS
jgi:hypothetical protein